MKIIIEFGKMDDLTLILPTFGWWANDSIITFAWLKWSIEISKEKDAK